MELKLASNAVSEGPVEFGPFWFEPDSEQEVEARLRLEDRTLVLY